MLLIEAAYLCPFDGWGLSLLFLLLAVSLSLSLPLPPPHPSSNAIMHIACAHQCGRSVGTAQGIDTWCEGFVGFVGSGDLVAGDILALVSCCMKARCLSWCHKETYDPCREKVTSSAPKLRETNRFAVLLRRATGARRKKRCR